MLTSETSGNTGKSVGAGPVSPTALALGTELWIPFKVVVTRPTTASTTTVDELGLVYIVTDDFGVILPGAMKSVLVVL